MAPETRRQTLTKSRARVHPCRIGGIPDLAGTLCPPHADKCPHFSRLYYC